MKLVDKVNTQSNEPKPILELEVTALGQMKLKSSLSPNEVCKVLSGLIIDITYQNVNPSPIIKA